jgi:hypothetical protein
LTDSVAKLGGARFEHEPRLVSINGLDRGTSQG